MKRIERQRMFEKLHQESGVSNEEYFIAYKRVKRIKAFYTHFIIYLMVNVGLVLNACFDQNSWGPLVELKSYATAFFWGIGIVAHGMSVFGRELFFGSNWEERKIKEFMNKDKNRTF
ncbi:2TM domain-containing protein [Flavobacterium aciduliphilum]|uniref:2TM domain-containing protein n=1 Tax=Flavobacterium aciduliphilum TaxID=1101402 RepID=A0A328YAA8_9FLAO|nr:2TM domain-containing protein [Flavobacterium aciduliphilum]RAR70103.1 2TM domain-containing protein [Flavobacterium aciduliphilum]